jgi:hypothetical protein
MKIKKIAFIILLIVGIPCVLIMFYFTFMDKIELLFPRTQAFKKVCEEINGKPFSWNEVKKLDGHCMNIINDGSITFSPCSEEYVEKYLDSKTLIIRSNPAVEGVWVCSFENINGNMKTEMKFIPL